MAEIAQDIRQLQKLDKVDLVVLLGRMEEELERFETNSAQMEKQNNALDTRNRELFEQNQTLSMQLQQSNQRLVEKETVAGEWQDMKECLRLMVETNRQLRDEMQSIRQSYEGIRGTLADSSSGTLQEMKSLVDELRNQAAASAQQRQQIDLQMLDGIQKAIDQARNSYGQMDSLTKAAPQAPDQQNENDGEPVTLTAEQAKMLGRILSRMRTEQQA